MLVHFSASARDMEKDISLYRKIINAVRTAGHAISHDWVETAWLMTQGKGRDANGWDLHTIAIEVEAGIEAAEVVIFEASGRSTLGVGYELATALHRRKPTLVLIDKSVAKDSYAVALRHDFLTVITYNESELERIIGDFLRENTVTTKDLRFNFVIDRKIYSYLKAKSFKSGKTKAEIVRDLLLEDLRGQKE